MEALQQAKKLYTKCHKHKTSLSEEDLKQLESDIQRFIRIGIKEASSSNLFTNQWMLDVLKSALNGPVSDNSSVIPTARAFECLEKYFLMLVEQPWKSEFKRIKTYGGFYKTKVEAVLKDPEIIFERAGYKLDPKNHVLVHVGPIQNEPLTLLAFDCRVASVECSTIWTHYNKVKSLGMKLSDAVSNILHDGWTRSEAISSKALRYSEMNASAQPPAVPRREPLALNNKLDRRNIHTEMPTGLMANGTNFSGALQSKNIPHSKMIPYMDESTEEIIPELPQGTSEDHMRESLRYLEEGPGSTRIETRQPMSAPYSEDWKWFREMQQPGKSMMACAAKSAVDRSSTYPPVIKKVPVTSSYPDASIDEGVADLSVVNRVQLPDARMHTTYAFSSDVGYPTGPSSDTVFLPPPVPMSDVRLYQSKPLSAPLIPQSCAPPPIPSRALKPNNLSTKSHLTSPNDILNRVMPLSSESSNTVDKPGIVPYVNTIESSAEPVLRRERLTPSGKASSLKYGENRSENARQVAHNRVARSMDLSPWECKTCTSSNTATSKICSVCSHSRYGPDKKELVVGQSRKSCPQCTFENPSKNSHCDMCSAKLSDHDTFV